MKRRATVKIEAEVARLEQPESMSKTQWRAVKAYLLAIARHYPKAYPSQATLAAELGRDVRSIRNYQRLATEAGLLLVKADAGKKGANHTWSRTHQYLILTPATIAGSIPEIFPTNPTVLRTYGELRSSHSASERHLPSDASGVTITRFDPEGQSRQVGPEVKPARSKTPLRRPGVGELVVDSGRKQTVPRPPKQPPWRQVANRFVVEWQNMVETTPAGYHLREVRPLESIRHCHRYLQAHFFGTDALTPKSVDDVILLVQQFVQDAHASRVRIKPGQSAWMCFTGAWGRVPDKPAEDDLYKEYFK